MTAVCCYSWLNKGIDKESEPYEESMKALVLIISYQFPSLVENRRNRKKIPEKMKGGFKDDSVINSASRMVGVQTVFSHAVALDCVGV